MNHSVHIPIWKQAPFIRLLVPLSAGVILQFFFPICKTLNELTLIVCLTAVLFSLLIPPIRIYGWEWITGLMIQIALLSLGRMIMEIRKDGSLAPEAGSEHHYFFVASLVNDPVAGKGAFKCLATIRYLCTGGKSCLLEREKVIIHFRLKPLTQLPGQLRTGALLIFSKCPVPIKNSGPDNGFDYERYCLFKQIQGQVFISPSEFFLVGESKSTFNTFLMRWRKKILKISRSYVPGKEENALLEALLIGYEEDLDRSLIQSYADTGVVHIIAISGLHLALIYQILQLFLNRIRSGRNTKWIKTVILISILWIFSLLSGASPSVLRSAVMFSFMLFARNISREPAACNSLATAGFMMICFDPSWLWDLGFQLSFSAVLSLIIFLEPIQRSVTLKNKMLNGIWKSMSVSISAQLLTTPLVLFYFHRFPNYFLFTNLLAVPLSSFILAGGILLCLISFLPPAAIAVGWVLGKSIRVLNVFITYTAKLPGAVTHQLSVNLAQVIILYLLLFCGWHFFKTGQRKWLLLSLACICFFLLIRASGYITHP